MGKACGRDSRTRRAKGRELEIKKLRCGDTVHGKTMRGEDIADRPGYISVIAEGKDGDLRRARYGVRG